MSSSESDDSAAAAVGASRVRPVTPMCAQIMAGDDNKDDKCDEHH